MGAARKKVLVVDDSATSIAMMKRILSALPCDVISASDGNQALSAISCESPDMILMDVQMPVMTGFELCRRVRQDGSHARIPIILITGLVDLSCVREGFESGCNGYLTKPVQADEVLAKVRNYLGLS